jgi:hypothetical protein
MVGKGILLKTTGIATCCALVATTKDKLLIAHISPTMNIDPLLRTLIAINNDIRGVFYGYEYALDKAVLICSKLGIETYDVYCRYNGYHIIYLWSKKNLMTIKIKINQRFPSLPLRLRLPLPLRLLSRLHLP